MSKETTIIPIHTAKQSAARKRIIPLGLLSGKWKEAFSPHECKVMIAEALNSCVYMHHLEIAGYLITKRRLCLVLRADPKRLDEQLRHFYRTLRKEILQRIHRREEWEQLPEEQPEEEKPVQLFVRYPLQNYMLIHLITGRKVQLPYYSPHLAKLKDKVNHENFCSAVDYSGAKGPVIVKLLKPSEFGDHTGQGIVKE